jgi:hypothetical protein
VRRLTLATAAAAALTVCGLAAAANAARLDACAYETCVSIVTPDEPAATPPPVPRDCAYIAGVWTCW